MKFNDLAVALLGKIAPHIDEEELKKKCAHLTRMGICKNCINTGFASEEGELECSSCKNPMTEFSRYDIDNAMEVE